MTATTVTREAETIRIDPPAPRVLLVSEDPFFIERVSDIVSAERGRLIACLGPAASPCVLEVGPVCALAKNSAIAIVDAPAGGVFRSHLKQIPAASYAYELRRLHPKTFVMLTTDEMPVGRGPEVEVSARDDAVKLLQWVLRALALQRSNL